MTPPKIPVQQNPAPNDNLPAVRTQQIRSDNLKRVCLNDIWIAAGSPTNRRPHDWWRSAASKRLAKALADSITGDSRNIAPPSVYRAGRGRSGGTYAHSILGLAYAEFVDAALGVEVREVFLRHKLADPTLADDILERASPEANAWAGQRALARAGRHVFTDVLKDHGVKGTDYGACTDTLYLSLFDKRARALKAERGLPLKASLRDAMTKLELACVFTGEALASERIVEEDCDGGEQCRLATARSAGFVRRAVEADRRDRRGRTPPPANDTTKADDAA